MGVFYSPNQNPKEHRCVNEGNREVMAESEQNQRWRQRNRCNQNDHAPIIGSNVLQAIILIKVTIKNNRLHEAPNTAATTDQRESFDWGLVFITLPHG
jgi:hypothetical protein